MPRDCGRWKKALFQNPLHWPIQAGPCLTVGGKPQWENPFFYRLSWVGWWPSSNVRDTSFDCYKHIMLRRCRQRLEGLIKLDTGIICIRMDTRQVVVDDVEDPSWDSYVIIKIGPRLLRCGTPQSISKLLEEFWLMRTRWVRQERKDEVHFFALPTTPKSVSQDF